MIALTPDLLPTAFEARAFGINGAPPPTTDPAELKQAAQQFEALLIQQMLKEVRNTTLDDDDGLFSSSQMDGYQQMFDREIALEMSRAGGFGLADRLLDQLRLQQAASPAAPSETGAAVLIAPNDAAALPIDRTHVLPGRPLRADPALMTVPRRVGESEPVPLPDQAAAPALRTTQAAAADRAPAFESREDFVRTLMPLARVAARRLGVPAEAIVAQAALETGWGRHMLTRADGQPGWNLFGIKAGADWTGEARSAQTLELRDGHLQPERARFRVYDSPRAAVEDYVDFLSGRSRYHQALAVGDDTAAFARGLQQAGYATDPDYAAKLERVAATLPDSGDA
ncbi:MAG: flagellar assembly peptidoglycan hydrolase FlgJ [Wenzhouxiangellaceae bacterium]|nr:flagellar assembly peptidoglycan hydrolase FlgJ [Wenzhouxiangellaceae bacterium]